MSRNSDPCSVRGKPSKRFRQERRSFLLFKTQVKKPSTKCLGRNASRFKCNMLSSSDRHIKRRFDSVESLESRQFLLSPLALLPHVLEKFFGHNVTDTAGSAAVAGIIAVILQVETVVKR